jgi:uncharacterized membrane protein YraQ (UPF0718 family)
MMEAVLGGLGHALSLAFAMFGEILWALILGFALSGVVQAVVSKGEMSRLLPDDSPRSLCIASGLGAASSSSPTSGRPRVVEASVTWNYTTILNLVFLTLAAVLVVRFLRTGGPAMLKLMGGPPAHAGSDG